MLTKSELCNAHEDIYVIAVVSSSEFKLLFKTIIRISRVRCAGHVQRTSNESILKRSKDWKPERIRRIGRPKLRWIDGVLEDIKKVGFRNWETVARDREAWRKVLRESEASIEL